LVQKVQWVQWVQKVLFSRFIEFWGMKLPIGSGNGKFQAPFDPDSVRVFDVKDTPRAVGAGLGRGMDDERTHRHNPSRGDKTLDRRNRLSVLSDFGIRQDTNPVRSGNHA
jgi:hypothetical protein